jgi:virulence-associated protein VapD
MTHRPTTLERAYELAQEGRCRTVSDIKQALQSEGFDRIQDSLYGPTLSAALRKLCQAHYVAPAEPAAEDETAGSTLA